MKKKYLPNQMKEAKICLCPESIKWIKKHLLKSARAKFEKLLKKGTIKKVIKKRSKKQLANDKRLGKMAKARARKAKRRKR
jgi:hypothetical protein